MMHTNSTRTSGWTRKQAGFLIAGCLVAGIAGGWFIRGLKSQAGTEGAAPAKGMNPPVSGLQQASSPAQLKEMADASAAPLLEKLKGDPQNADLLAGVGNVYYDAQLYPTAVDYYGRSLQAKASNAAVRTDMATAYWYMGDADSALAEFDKALSYAPTNANTLFNRGLVRWKGKGDSAGALADWEKLLVANPNYQEKDKVKEMIADVKNHGAGKP